jgi:Lon-like ATP-dependent protease
VVIFPEANRKDYEEVAEDLKEGMTPHFVENYRQVYELALQAAAEAAAAVQGEEGAAVAEPVTPR